MHPATADRGDPGVSAERTAMAWRRTCQVYVAAGAVGTRVLAHHGSPWAAAPVVAAAALAAFASVAAARRFIRSRARLTEPVPAEAPAGAAVLAVVVSCQAALGVLALLALMLNGHDAV